MRKEILKQVDSISDIPRALEWAGAMLTKALEAGSAVIRLSRPTRSLDQNSKLWALLTDLSRQVEWYGNKLTPEEWKDVMTAAVKKQKAIPGIDGGFVVIGAHTSRMTVSELSEVIECIYAFGAEQNVKFSEDNYEHTA